MRISDFLLGLLVLAGAATLAYASSGFPAIPGQQYGADVFPMLTAAGLALCGGILAVGAAREGLTPHAQTTWANENGALLRVLGTLILMVGFLFAAPRIGFIASSVILLLGLYALLKVRPVVAITAALAAVLITYFAFNNLLRVPLPRGLLEGLI